MPSVVDYSQVMGTLTRAGLVSLYHDSGAFGFAKEQITQSAGWLVRDDSTIRATARAMARIVSPPTIKNLATMAGAYWAERLGDQPAWVMPKSHWAYELEFGNAAWLPAALAEVGVDASKLIGRNDGSAIEFAPAERLAFETFIERLLAQLAGSDFIVVFSGTDVLCTVHHHQQLWWTTRIGLAGLL